MNQNKEAPRGIILVDKMTGITSHDVVDMVRRQVGIRRVGHAGTLDPAADGLLIILVGKATKQFDEFMGLKKEYEAVMTLGEETDSGDRQGKVVKTGDWSVISEEHIREVFARFQGELEQVPPQVSAIKHKGRRLYTLAREGERVELPPRKIVLYANEVTGIDRPRVSFLVRCSKGTYIRKLAQDMGNELGCYAHLSALRRTAIGPYSVKDAVSIEDLRAGKYKLIEV